MRREETRDAQEPCCLVTCSALSSTLRAIERVTLVGVQTLTKLSEWGRGGFTSIELTLNGAVLIGTALNTSEDLSTAEVARRETGSLLSATVGCNTGIIHAVVVCKAKIKGFEHGRIRLRNPIDTPLEATHVIGWTVLSTDEDATTGERARFGRASTTTATAKTGDNLSLADHVHALDILVSTLSIAYRSVETVNDREERHLRFRGSLTDTSLLTS